MPSEFFPVSSRNALHWFATRLLINGTVVLVDSLSSEFVLPYSYYICWNVPSPSEPTLQDGGCFLHLVSASVVRDIWMAPPASLGALPHVNACDRKNNNFQLVQKRTSNVLPFARYIVD